MYPSFYLLYTKLSLNLSNLFNILLILLNYFDTLLIYFQANYICNIIIFI